jgi:hypothetical protein
MVLSVKRAQGVVDGGRWGSQRAHRCGGGSVAHDSARLLWRDRRLGPTPRAVDGPPRRGKPLAGTDESILLGYTTAPDNLNDALTTIAATDNGALNATAGLATALFSSLPAYDETLYENALQSGSVLDALLDPIAADLGLGSVIG